MRRILDFIKEKSYFFLGGTVLLLILIIAIGSCSNSKPVSYDNLENNMVSAAKKYYSENKKNLPKEGVTIKVSTDTLIEEGYLNNLVDPKDSSNKCSGYVEVTNEEGNYSYLPFLTCKGTYELSYLTDVIKKTQLDEYGNGVYEIDGEYIYRGDEVNNYVSFADKLWRIVKIDSEGDIKLVLAKYLDERISWDNTYNPEKRMNAGNTTNYSISTIRKMLHSYYKDNFNTDQKASIVSKKLCIGKFFDTDMYSKEKECETVLENEKIGLLVASDYKNASLDANCTHLNSVSCSNYNYFYKDSMNTWLLTTSNNNTYTAYYLDNYIAPYRASSSKKILPVIYISKRVLTTEGKGSLEKPFIIKQ